MKTVKTTKIKKMSNGGDPGDGAKAARLAGIITPISGMIGQGIKMIKDYSKKRRAVVQGAKAIKAANPNVKRKDAMKASRDFINNPTSEAKRGGSVKRKYQTGGSSKQGMYNTSSSGQNRTSGSTYGSSPQAKRGGSVKSKTKK